MKFTERNDWTIRLTDEAYFEQDKKLFYSFFPGSKLKEQIEKVNDFTKRKLSEKMVFQLLSVVSPEEILENRGIKEDTSPVPEPTGENIGTGEKSQEDNDVKIPGDKTEKEIPDTSAGEVTNNLPAIFDNPDNSKKKDEKANSPE